jgi:hypothetical protein
MPAVSKERALRIIRWRSAAAFAITFVNVAVALVFLGTLAYFLGTIVVSIPDFSRMMTEPPGNFTEEEAWTLAGLSLYPLFLVVAYVAIFVLPIVLTLPLSAPIISLWQYPPTFLILRPFHRGVLSKPLKHIARREIAPLGHTYTLSDADIHVPWYVRVPLVLGQLALFSFRLKIIRSSGRLGAIDRAMRRTWLRNVNWCLSWNKLFAVASTDEHWQAVVDVLLARADVVVIDVSDLRDHVVWEIERAHTLGAAARVLYLVDADQKSRITSQLASLLPDSFDAARVFAYDGHRLLEHDRFRSVAVDALPPADERTRGRLASALSVAATVLFVITVVPLALLQSGLGNVRLPSRYSTWPRVPAVVDPMAVATMGLGLLTLALLAIASRANRPMRFLLTVQALLLLGAGAGMLEW